MEYRNRPGVAQRVPGGLGSQISMTFGTWRWWGCQPHAAAAFTPGKCSWYSLSLGDESTPGPWYGRKEYVTEKSNDTTVNRSRDRLTSSVESKTMGSPFWVRTVGVYCLEKLSFTSTKTIFVKQSRCFGRYWIFVLARQTVTSRR